MAANLPNFEAPPINEVAMGVQFAPIEGLLHTHFGLFWSLVKEEFSKSDEAAPLGTAEGLWINQKTNVPLPRTWLVHDETQCLIQLQPDIFYFNWRRQADDQNYPSYAEIKPLFYKYLWRYVDFLTGEKLLPPEQVKCDLTYVNIIPRGEGDEPVEFLAELLPDVSWRLAKDRYLPLPKALSWQATIEIEEAIELTANVNPAARKTDDHPVLRLQISARDTGPGSSLDATEPWFDRAHDAIVLSFIDLTSERKQRELWKRTDAAS